MSFTVIVKRKGSTLVYAQAGDAMQVTREPIDAEFTITYDEDEKRLPVERKMGYHQAFRLLRQDTGQRMAVINASSETSAIYGIEEIRASQFPGRTLPLTYLVDLMLKADVRSTDGQPFLVAVFLGEAHKAGVPLVLLGLNGDRTMVLQDPVPSVADFATTVANVLGSMVNTLRGLDFDPRQAARSDDARGRLSAFLQSRVVVTTIFELVPLAARAKTYPREPLYRGVRHSVLTRAVLGTSLAVLAATALAAAAAEWTRRAVKAETIALESALQERREELGARLLGRLGGLPSRISLDTQVLFGAAEAISAAGGKVSLTATLQGAELVLEVPNLRMPTMNRRAALARMEPDSLLRALRTDAPPGWSRRSLENSGDLNAWTVRFAGASLERDLLDLVDAGGTSGAAPVAPGGPGPGRVKGGA